MDDPFVMKTLKTSVYVGCKSMKLSVNLMLVVKVSNEVYVNIKPFLMLQTGVA